MASRVAGPIARELSILNRSMNAFNEFSGWNALEKLKVALDKKVEEVEDTKHKVVVERKRYEAAVISRSTHQNDINILLQRKANWNQADVAEFTRLVGCEHVMESNEALAKTALYDMEKNLEEMRAAYEKMLQKRYQEEICIERRTKTLSNIVQWSVLGLNAVFFLSTQLVFEPRKREQLMSVVNANVEQHAQMKARVDTIVGSLKMDIAHLTEATSANTKLIESMASGDNIKSTVGTIQHHEEPATAAAGTASNGRDVMSTDIIADFGYGSAYDGIGLFMVTTVLALVLSP